jgi:DNA-binding CsgD family transcriptional regulator
MHVAPDGWRAVDPDAGRTVGRLFPGAAHAGADVDAGGEYAVAPVHGHRRSGRASQVYVRLSPRQRAVLHAFAAGQRPDEVAANLHITLSTVNTHKTAILAECRNAVGVGRDAALDYRFLREHFAGFIQRLEGV